MMNVNEYFKSNKHPECDWLFKRITCKDGFSISVQGHYGAYSNPRINNADYYTEVECGYPSAKPELIMDYCEDSEKPTDTVYGYVPVELVDQLIELHGGIDV